MPDRTNASAAPGTVVPGEKRGQHNVAIVREMHAFLKSTDSEIRTFGQSKVSVAAQFEYIVLQKAQQMHQRRTRWLHARSPCGASRASNHAHTRRLTGWLRASKWLQGRA